MENIYKVIFEKSYDSIMVCNKEGTIIMVNPATEEIYEMKASEMVGHKPNELLNSPSINPHPERPIISNTSRVIETKQISSSIIEHPTHLAFVTSVPVFDEAGNIKYVISNARADVVINEFYRQQEGMKEQNDLFREMLHYLSQNKEKNIIAKSPQMKRVMEQCRIIANADCNVLITGESGAGKEVIAQYIHQASENSDKPFVPVNCSAIPHELFESELFGYLSGAFTGANKGGKKGLIQMAHTGTLFLDELGELPLSMQAKLLRFIETGEFYPVGSSTPKKVNVRIIAATNRDLNQMVAEKSFRADLHYRLNVFPIEIAPLRNRPEDLEALAVSFLEHFNRKYKRELAVSNYDLRLLHAYSWPGNVRELRNMMERAVLLADSSSLTQALQSILPGSGLNKEDFIKSLRHTSDETDRLYLPVDLSCPFKEAMAKLESDYIKAALEKHGGNVEETAAALGIHRATLYRKIIK